MAVRRPTARTSTLDVTCGVNGRTIALHRESCYDQKKSLLYSKMNSIKKGKLKLPIPLSKIKNRVFGFEVTLENKLKLLYSF